MDKKLAVVGGGMLVLGVLLGFIIEDISHGYGGHHGHDYDKSEYRDADKPLKTAADDHSMHMMEGTTTMETMMHSMDISLEGKTGAEFDAAFLQEMIIHHEGAVEMAKAARERAADPRIKALAEAIITAQEKEIADMKAWQATSATPAAQ